MLTFLLYILNIYKRWNLPCKYMVWISLYDINWWFFFSKAKKSFYRYALFLSFVNIFQAIGSMMWFNGLNHKKIASAGIWYIHLLTSDIIVFKPWLVQNCLSLVFRSITMATTDIYLITFAPVVYWIFLRNYFR